MKIGYKIGLIIFCVFALLIGIGIAAQKYIVAPGFVEIEKWFIRNEIGWINDLTNRESGRIDSLCKDWATWDDTYEYVLSNDEDYIETNFSAETLANNYLNFAAIVDLQGNIIVARSCDIENEELTEVILEDFETGMLSPDNPLIMKSDSDKLVGIGVSLKGPVFIAARPIVRTDGTGPFVGTLIMAHIFNDNFLGEIFSNAGHSVKIASHAFNDCGNEYDSNTYISTLPSGSYCICKELKTVYGNEDYSLNLITPDFVGKYNKRYNIIILSLIVLVCLFALLLMLAIITKVIVKPIRNLENHIRQITENKSLELLPVGKTNDEVSMLAVEFNKMLMRLKEDQQLQEQMTCELKESNSNLQQFAHSISHDLKEPLRSITSYLQLIQLTLKPEGEVAEYMGHVLASSKRMYHTISDLLEYSKSSSMNYPLKQCDTKAIVNNVVSELNLIIKETGAIVDIGQLPEVLGYEPLLSQIFRNLLANAIKYRRKDITPRIEVGCDISNDQKTFYVKDNGKGIDPQYHKKIFELFERLEHDGNPGTGIGLAICKKVTQRHNGKIWVDSTPGEGSAFYFTVNT